MSDVVVSPGEVAITGDTRSGHLVGVTGQLAKRSLLFMVRIPATVIPVIIMPVFFTLAFSGAFGAIAEIPGFPTDNVLNWMVPFAILQGAAFAGLGAAFGAARDLETGFFDRLLLSPTRRLYLALGPLVYSALRAFLPVVIVLPVGYIGGARIEGGLVGLFTLVLAAVSVAVLAGLWGLGVSYRTRTQRSGALIQTGIFVVLFLSTGQVPLAVMQGWMHEVASLNPFTQVLDLARQGFLGPVTWGNTWPGIVAIALSGVVLALFAWRGFRKLVA